MGVANWVGMSARGCRGRGGVALARGERRRIKAFHRVVEASNLAVEASDLAERERSQGGRSPEALV